METSQSIHSTFHLQQVSKCIICIFRMIPTFYLIFFIYWKVYWQMTYGPYWTSDNDNPNSKVYACQKLWWSTLLFFNNVYGGQDLKEVSRQSNNPSENVLFTRHDIVRNGKFSEMEVLNRLIQILTQINHIRYKLRSHETNFFVSEGINKYTYCVQTEQIIRHRKMGQQIFATLTLAMK